MAGVNVCSPIPTSTRTSPSDLLTLAAGCLALWARHSITSGIEMIADPFAGSAIRAPQQPVPAGQEPAANILVLGNDSRTRASYPSQREEGAQCTDALLFKGLAEGRVGAYLTEHPSVVEMLPTAVN